VQNSDCLQCFCKHIATANVYEEEAKLGYPLHKWLAVGQLAAAENEVLTKYPELSETTREYRKQFMDNDSPVPTLELINLALNILEEENKKDILKIDGSNK
jgi:hypothetical protein